MSIKNIEPSLELIKNYLKLKQSEQFSIPAYQRAYSWGIDECDKLWQDIESFGDSGAEDPYFFGTIILDCSDPEHKKLDLIDGQQRTTTFMILLKALQLKISNALQEIESTQDQNDPTTRALRKGLQRFYDIIMGILYKADDDDLIAIENDWNKAKGVEIITNNSINELYKNDLINIIESQDFSDALRSTTEIKYKKKDNRYTNFFRNFKFFYQKIEEHKSETWLYNFAKVFLEKCQVIVIRSWDIEQAIMMFNSLNSTGMPLADADIISAQLYSKSRNRNQFIERWKNIIKTANDLKLVNIVSIDSILQQAMYILRAKNKEYKENQVTTPGVRRYYVSDHKDLLDDPETLCSLFEKLLDIWNKIKDYSSIKLLLKFNENFKFFLISYLQRFEAEEIEENSILPFVESLIKLFAVKELVDSGYSSSKFKTFLFNENFRLVNNGYSIQLIESDFNNHIKNSWDRSALEEALDSYSGNILVYLNEYLYAKSKGNVFSLRNSVNIEHIMPASGHNLEQIRIDAGMIDQEEFDLYANKLGNKILLEEDINKSIGNDWFRTKKGSTVADKRGYLGSQFSLAQALSRYPKGLWQKEDIDDSTKKATKRILDFIFG